MGRGGVDEAIAAANLSGLPEGDRRFDHLALTSSEQARAMTASALFGQVANSSRNAPAIAASYNDLATAEQNLRAVAGHYHGRADLSTLEEAELEAAARPVVVALVMRSARQSGEAAFPIPARSVQSFAFPAYCMDPHAGAPARGEPFQLVPAETLIPADLLPTYKGLLHNTAARNGGHDDNTQGLIWQIRQTANGSSVGQPLQLSDQQRQALLAADPNALNILQSYYLQGEGAKLAQDALNSGLNRLLGSGSLGSAASRPLLPISDSAALQTIDQTGASILARQSALLQQQDYTAYTLLTPSMAARTTSPGGYSSVNVEVANAADGPAVFLPGMCVAQAARKVQRLAIQANLTQRQTLMTPAPWFQDQPVKTTSALWLLKETPSTLGLDKGQLLHLAQGPAIPFEVAAGAALIAYIAAILVASGLAASLANQIAQQNVGQCLARENTSDAKQKIQRQVEYEKARDFCNTPPPEGPTECSTLSKAIDHAERCVDLYSAWDARWEPSRHDEKIDQWTNRINNLKSEYSRKCTK